MKMANTYNPYSDVKNIYDLKGQWDEANRAGDTAKKNQIAATAQVYYDNLKNNNYNGVAKALSNSDYQGAKSILDSYSPPVTNSEDTTKSPVETNNLKSNEVNRENAGLFDKYNESYDYLTKTNPLNTDEAKAILGKYSLAGLQARDNATATGGGSNGGNIDSYAAANALRQQSALIGQGQSKVLESHQQKIDNIRGLLSDMGVNIDRVFNQDETAKNNDVARKSEIASVTGYAPTEWSIQNDAFLKNFVDENGKLREEYNDTDFQALINSAKARGDNDLAHKYSILRGLKIFGNFDKYGKYLKEGDIAYIEPKRTAEYELTDKQLKSAENIALGEAQASALSAQAEAEADYNKSYLDYMGKVYTADRNAETKYAEIEAGKEDPYASFNLLRNIIGESGANTRKISFLDEVLKDYYDGTKTLQNSEELMNLILNNTEEYNIDTDDAKLICAAFGADDDWIDNYRDRTDSDSTSISGRVGSKAGMIAK